MQCDKRKCKKCGMWWVIKGHDESQKPFEYETCGYRAIHTELVKHSILLVGVRQDTEKRANKAMEGINDMINMNQKIRQLKD